MKNRAFTLIEIICATSLCIIVFLQIFNISHLVITNNEKTKNDLLISQSTSDLEAYIKNALDSENISLDYVDDIDGSVNFRVFYSIDDNYCRVANKKLFFDKINSKIKMRVTNELYKKNGSTYTLSYSDKSGTNVVAENVSSMDVSLSDDKLSFCITMSMNNVENKLEFYVKNIKKQELI